MNQNLKTQQSIEHQLEQYTSLEISEDKTMRDLFGPIEDWTLELGSQTLLLHPAEKTWYYLDQLHQSWERTGFSPGETEFVEVENKLGVRREKDKMRQPEAEDAVTVFRTSSNYLLVVDAPEFTQPVPVGAVINIGRSKENDIVLNDKLSSRSHARIICDGNTLAVEDLKITNCTQVNGVEIEDVTPLNDHDTILIGNTVIRVTTVDIKE